MTVHARWELDLRLTLSDGARNLAHRLEMFGLSPSLAVRLAASSGRIRDEFPEPKQEVIEETIELVAKHMWADQHWANLFGAPAPDDTSNRFQALSRRIVEGLLQTGLWPLLCYMFWVRSLSLDPNDGDPIYAIFQKFHLEKINARIFEAGPPIPTPDELYAALDLLEIVFDPLDVEALADDNLRRLVQAREAATTDQFRDRYQCQNESPARSLFGWARVYGPCTGIKAEDIALVTERLDQYRSGLNPESGHDI